MARPTTRQMTFADLELAFQGVQLDPTLQAICDLLDQNREVLERVQCDLHRGLKNPSKGRRGLTARQVVGALVLMRIKNWDYRELRERIADGVTLRQFTDFHCDKVPKHDAFNRGINRLTPETLKDLNDMLLELL
jgi:transposase, IS5 family